MAKLNEITDAQRRSLARRHLTGQMLVDLTGTYGLELDQVRKLFRQPKTLRIIDEEQAFLDTKAVKLRNRMSYGLEDSIDRMKARGNGVDGPQLAFAADKFLIEQILPKQERHVIDQRQTISFDAQVAFQFSDAVNTVKTIAAKLTGDTAKQLAQYTQIGLEGIDSAIEPGELTVSAPPKGNGSSPGYPIPPHTEPDSDDDS